MKNIFKELNPLGLRLSLIAGVNWLISKVIKLLYLMFLIVASAIIVKESTTSLKVDPEPFGVLMILILLLAPLLYIRKGVQTVISKLLRNTFLAMAFIAGYTKQVTESQAGMWIIVTMISIGVYYFSKWLQPKVFQRYLFNHVLNKDYLGIRKVTDKLPPESNLFVDVKETNPHQRMVTINKHAIKEEYQGVVELSFLNQETITGISHYQRAWNGEAAPIEKEFIEVDTIYHPVFYVRPFGDKDELDFQLVHFDISRKDAFTVTGTSLLKKFSN